jgi:hypothetical protein
MITKRKDEYGHEITTYSNDMSFDEIVITMAEEHQKNIEPGHGFFFDFSKTIEYKEPVLKYLIENYGWKMDYDGTFIRKPEI